MEVRSERLEVRKVWQENCEGVEQSIYVLLRVIGLNRNADEMAAVPFQKGYLDAVCVVQAALKSRQVGNWRQRNCSHLVIKAGVVGVEGGQSRQLANPVVGLAG